MKKAIIAFGVGYAFDDMKFFIHSCHVHTPKADLFIFAGANIDELKVQTRDYPRVHFVRFKESIATRAVAKVVSRWPAAAQAYARLLRYLALILPVRSVVNEFASPLTQFMVKRFFKIEQLIKTLDHDQFMITDLRDVILQGNPFQLLNENTLITGIEPVTIQKSEMNAGWMQATYPSAVYNRLKLRAVACAGVTVGGRKAIFQYINEMVEETYKHLPRVVNKLGADQAIHIRLFYERLKGLDLHLEANGSGSIATLHFSKLQEFKLEDGTLENRTGKPLTIIHQYDRHPHLMTALREGLLRGTAFANAQ
jgi:hypothetical protein